MMAELKEKKVTEREYYTKIKELVEDVEIQAFCDKKLAQLDRKHSKVDTGKLAQDRAYVALIERALMEKGSKMTIAEIKATNNELMILSSSKMSYLLRSMTNVHPFKEGKTAYFELV